MKARNEISTVKVYIMRDGYEVNVCSLRKKEDDIVIDLFISKYNDKEELKDILKQLIDGVDKLD